MILWTMDWDTADLSEDSLKRAGILSSYRRDLDFIEKIEVELKQRIDDLVPRDNKGEQTQELRAHLKDSQEDNK